MSQWPVVLQHGAVRLRPLRRSDRRAWRRLREENAAWLRPWEATSPDQELAPRTFGQMVRDLDRQARAGRAVPLAIEHEGALAGQLTISGIMWGSMRSAQAGYWVDQARAGRGVAPTALALAIDHCLLEMRLHRVEVNIRPENAASLRVVEKLGLRDEGLRRELLHIDGAWRDHRSFAVTASEAPEGVLLRLRSVSP